MLQGLTAINASEKLKEFGYNELPSSRPRNLLKIAGDVMKEPMFLLLISCGVLYIILGDYGEGVILLAAILVIIFISFFQHRKTEKALDALKNLASPRALVLRDGVETRIPGREVVPGDIIILNEGDRIAADALVLDGVNLTIDESLLTGESVPTMKTKGDGSTTENIAYSGTLVVQGKGLAEVMATGIHTQFGKIGTSLQQIGSDETRLQKEMKLLIRNLFLIGIIICIGVVLSFYFTRGNLVKSLLNGLASAMAILPEEFPVVFTVFLAIGAWRLSKKNVLTRKPSAIETLGSTTVLCTDKTGTITQNRMAIAALYDGRELLEKDLFINGQQKMIKLIRSARMASQEKSIDPMEEAISKAHQLLSPEEFEFKVVKEYPLSSKLFAMTHVIENNSGDQFPVSAKGAPEAIFELCKLPHDEKQKHEKVVHELAEKGYRVIAVANAMHKTGLFPETQHGFEFQFLGLIGLEDPVRPEVPEAIRQCTEAGIKVIIITGDFPVTARSIAQQIGIATSAQTMTGDELNMMSDEELKKRITGTNVFARVVPEQKLRIVEALKSNNEVVAMTGDGVNDAPALKSAHIGIAMGNKGTDVAREASSLVLMDDNFASIVAAIRSGRRIFDNLQKAMSYILAIHIPIIGLALLPAFFPGIPLLLLPLHIVFMELIIDPVCSVAFESEQEEKGIMTRPPRDPEARFFGIKKIIRSLVQGFLLLAAVVSVYFLSIREGHSEGEVRAIAFSSLIIGNVFLILANLSKTRSFVSVFTERNYAAISILLTAIVVLILIISIPSLQKVFSFEFPGYKHFISSLTASAVLLIILEANKFMAAKRRRSKLLHDR